MDAEPRNPTSEEATQERSAVVERTCRTLRALGNHGQGGARLVDLTNATGMTRPAALRILRTLLDEGFALHDGRRYRLGPAMFQLSLAAPNPLGDLEPIRRIVRDLAAAVGDTVYLSLRQGDRASYLLREEGAFPVRTHLVTVGEIKPLCATYGGITLLAAMPPEEARAILEQLLPGPEGADRRATLAGMITAARARGHVAGADLVLRGVAGLGVAVRAPGTEAPFLALTISAITPRLEEERIAELLPRLTRARDAIEAVMARSLAGA